MAQHAEAGQRLGILDGCRPAIIQACRKNVMAQLAAWWSWLLAASAGRCPFWRLVVVVVMRLPPLGNQIDF